MGADYTVVFILRSRAEELDGCFLRKFKVFYGHSREEHAEISLIVQILNKKENPGMPGFFGLVTATGLLIVQEAAQHFRAAWVTQFTQCFSFDLTDTFTGDVELFAHFFQSVVSVHIDTETHTQNFRLTRC
ncbi:Uncharacterised protein [Yersinia kristensenii]|uniref:Uncharacterized protein n=1 Tax=Yersinia kristensenii TaxID=28152 RepID=A0A0T9L5V5_YERKR|nr:Uncharacterised protein [Yersinia kristensenii]